MRQKYLFSAGVLAAVGEAFDQQLARRGQATAPVLHLQPFTHILGKTPPSGAVGEQRLHPLRQMRGERQAQPAITGDGGALLRGAERPERQGDVQSVRQRRAGWQVARSRREFRQFVSRATYRMLPQGAALSAAPVICQTDLIFPALFPTSWQLWQFARPDRCSTVSPAQKYPWR